MTARDLAKMINDPRQTLVCCMIAHHYSNVIGKHATQSLKAMEEIITRYDANTEIEQGYFSNLLIREYEEKAAAWKG